MKATMKINTVMVLLWLLFSTSVHAQDSTGPVRHEFSVQQAIDYAVKNNVVIKNSLLDIQIQKQTNREYTGIAYPQISGSGSLTYNASLPVSLIPAEFLGGTPGTYEKFAFGVKWNATGGVALSQILFDGQVFTGLRARGTLMEFQQKKAEVTEELIRTNIYKVYYQLVASKTQIELLNANIERLEKLRHDTRVMYQNGFAEKLAVDRLDVQITNLNTEKINALAQISNGYLGLKVLIGMPVREELVLTDTLSSEMIKEGVLEATAFDYSQRKEFELANIGLKLKEYDIQRYKQSKIPTLTLNGYYNKNAQRNSFNFFKSNGGDWFDISAFTLNLNIPIFSGFVTNSRIARAKLSMQQTVNQIDSLKISIDNEILVAKNNLSAAISNLDYQKENMALAETVYEQTKKKFEIGTGSQTEITNAQTDLKGAQTNYINSLYNAIIARIDFLKATGKL